MPIIYEGQYFDADCNVYGTVLSGNPVYYYNGTDWNFDWEKGRQLVSASGGGKSITYTYDLAGIRDSKTVGGVTYHYDTLNGKVVRQSWDGNTLDIIYDPNGSPYACWYNNTYCHYILNQQGDVIRMTLNNGTIMAEYQYDAWGNIISKSGELADINPIRYRGYYYDAETGFYYLQSRYYDPSIGRFINADALIANQQVFLGYNIFGYCLNNPVRYKDTLGNQCEDAAEDKDEYKLVGGGVQIDFSGSLGINSLGGCVGFGFEVIIYWDTPECAANGGPVVACYVYNDGNGYLDTQEFTDLANEIAELLTENVDLIKMDGIDAITAVLSGSTILNSSISGSVSLLGVWANSDFYGKESYEKGFENFSATAGSGKYGYAWSDSCKTHSLGYSATLGKPLLHLALPTFSRGKSYYRLIQLS